MNNKTKGPLFTNLLTNNEFSMWYYEIRESSALSSSRAIMSSTAYPFWVSCFNKSIEMQPKFKTRVHGEYQQERLKKACVIWRRALRQRVVFPTSHLFHKNALFRFPASDLPSQGFQRYPAIHKSSQNLPIILQRVLGVAYQKFVAPSTLPIIL